MSALPPPRRGATLSLAVLCLVLGFLLGVRRSAGIEERLRAGELARLAGAELHALLEARRYGEVRDLLARVCEGRTIRGAAWMDADGTVKEVGGERLEHPGPPGEAGVGEPHGPLGGRHRDAVVRLPGGTWLRLATVSREMNDAVPGVAAALALLVLASLLRRARRAPPPDR